MIPIVPWNPKIPPLLRITVLVEKFTDWLKSCFKILSILHLVPTRNDFEVKKAVNDWLNELAVEVN